MRRKYSTLVALLTAAAAAADPCPPALQTIAGQVATLRQVPAPFLPPCRYISADGLRGELDTKLRRDLPVSPELFVEALFRLGFIDGEPAAVYPRLLSFYSSQVLGFYEPGADEMVLVRKGKDPSSADSTVWAHELAHAAQERRFGLPTALLGMRHNGDQQRATSALAEGDATLVMLALGPSGTPPLSSLWETQRQLASQADSLPTPEGVPEFFVRDLVFPYAQGLATVLASYQKGGWKAVDELLRSPPATTSELLHPGQRPLGPPLGDSSLPPLATGWTSVLTDTMGEWALAYWLGRRIAVPEASRLAAAWDGDRLRLSRNRQGEWALTLVLRCRRSEACGELARVLRNEGPVLLSNLSRGHEPAADVTLTGSVLTVQSPPACPPPR